jgi:hypothetical protein
MRVTRIIADLPVADIEAPDLDGAYREAQELGLEIVHVVQHHD